MPTSLGQGGVIQCDDTGRNSVKLMCIQMSSVITNFNLQICMMGSDSWQKGSGEEFGDFA